MRTPPPPLVALSGLLLVGASDAVARAQEPARPVGFTLETAGRQAELEALLIRLIHPDSVARWARALAAGPHVAGTPAQAATRDSVLAWHRAAGIEARYDSLILYLPQPISNSVQRTHPDPMTFDLTEPALAEDPATQHESVPVFNAYSGTGTAEADVVFANYGLPPDYRALDSAGVTVRGKVVLARYGRSFRGIKVREAEARGAVALLLFSDPESDGFERGEVYPQGPMRPPSGVQRGSILGYSGDPSTPDGPSTAGAPRASEDRMSGVARIPVVPIGYGVAGELLRHLGGPEARETWQGGIDLMYRLGPGPARARVTVEAERGEAAYHAAYNTVAVLEGTVWPDEWVVIGAHRDAWSPGAVDNVSGTSSVVEVARAFGAAAAAGVRPRRTVMFATWDAEEWGITGSIEWVEANAERLRSSVVAYVNLDAPVSGPSFGAASSPELKTLVVDASRRVDEPTKEGSVFDAWLARAVEAAEPGETPDTPPVGDLGGGSDHQGFYQHLGIPALGLGFGGPGGVYHSMYDTPRWMQLFGDPGYLYHAATARLAAVIVARLANADVLPFDHAGLVDVVGERVAHLATDVAAALEAATATEHIVGETTLVESGESRLSESVRSALTALNHSLTAFGRQSRTFAGVRDSVLTSGPLDDRVARKLNGHVRAASLAFAGDRGIPGDGWSRQLLFASDPDNGYATLPLPAIRLALRGVDLAGTADRLWELAGRFEEARDHLVAATAVCRGTTEARG